MHSEADSKFAVFDGDKGLCYNRGYFAKKPGKYMGAVFMFEGRIGFVPIGDVHEIRVMECFAYYM